MPGIAAVASLLWFLLLSPAHAGQADEARDLNRDGMVEMSQAQFESAADKFLAAAQRVPDYGLSGGELRYTPTFMAAWAYEKIGRRSLACRYFSEFLRIASETSDEPTKLNHARDYLRQFCPD